MNKDVAEKLYALLRAAMGGGVFDEALTDDAWRWLYREATRQSLLGVCYVNRADMPMDVAMAWATEGHSVALPGLGSMRFGLRSKSVEDVNDVKASLIKSRRIIFTPSTDLKDELSETAVQITCYDRNGVEIKRVTSTDPGTVEEPDNTDDNGENQGGTGENQGGNTGGNTGDNTGGGDDDGKN